MQSREASLFELESLFEGVTARASGGSNQLGKTAELTELATQIANHILRKISSNAAAYEEKVAASQQSHDAMDALIHELYDFDDVDVNFLEEEDEETLKRMLRSQQSKRSRAKSKVMTKENYMTLMTAAIAETLLRKVLKMPKTGGTLPVDGSLDISEEELQALAADPEALRKAIRNVQSKKSIMKSKADFSEDNPRWQQLLMLEAKLKALRDQGTKALNAEMMRAIETTKALDEMLEQVDTSQLSVEEAKNLLDSLKALLNK